MPAAIQFECEVSAQSIADFTKALADYQRKTQRDMRGALRSATIDLCRSLRARTRRAPKQVPREDVRFGEEEPKYYTGKKDGKVYRRVVVSRWFGGKRKQFVHWQEVQTKYRSRKTRKGISESWSEATAGMLREARQRFGKVRMWGLAKKSWGWFMHSLFKTATQDENPKAVVTRRMVEGGMVEKREPLPDGTIDLQAPIRCEITLVNKLDYIRKALQPGTLAMAVEKATRYIRGKIESGVRSRKFGN